MKNTFLATLLLITASFYGQTDKKQPYSPPDEARFAFEKEFPKTNAVWRSEFAGDDGNEELYVADFTVQGTRVSAYYNLRGELQVLEHAVKPNKLPQTIQSYLKKNYPTYKIVEAARIRKTPNYYTYEVGLTSDSKFYDAVFSDAGDFLQMVEKDR